VFLKFWLGIISLELWLGIVSKHVTFIELWLGMTSLELCSEWQMNTSDPCVVARIGECCQCEYASCNLYKWVHKDCPPQYLANEFGSLGTL